MEIFENAWAIPALGIIVGCVVGYVARSYHFCTLAALERHWYAGDSSGLRAWVLAAAVALIGTTVLQALGVIDISSAFYLQLPVPVAGAVIGGVMFGIGMALVGTCGFGAIIRFGGGNLRALVVLTGMGLAAIAAQRGLTGYFRQWVIEPFSFDLTRVGGATPGSLFAFSGSATAATIAGFLVGGALLAWCFYDKSFQRNFEKIVAGLTIGLCVVAGWFVTSAANAVGFEPYQVESASFVAPVGDTILQIVMVTGQLPDYGVGLMVGVFVGAAIAAWLSDDVRWEACDDARELGRHLAGAFLMGTGGVFALGCTIGQGVTSVSTLSLTAPIAIGSIALGTRIGLSFLMEGKLFGFLNDRVVPQKHPAE